MSNGTRQRRAAPFTEAELDTLDAAAARPQPSAPGSGAGVVVHIPNVGRVHFPAGMDRTDVEREAGTLAAAADRSGGGTLAQRVRGVTGDAYADLSDAELERRVLARYPQYGDLPRSEHRDANPDEPRSVGGFLANVVSSGGQLLADSAQGLVTAARVLPAGNWANPVGALAALQTPEAQAVGQALRNPGTTAAALGRYLRDRYGSVDALKRTAYEDPVGALADVATVATGGGSLAARAPGVVGRVGRAVAAAGHAADPMRLAGAAVARTTPAVQRGLETAGEALNAAALNVPRTLARRNAGVNLPRQLAEEGLIVSRGSAAELGRRIRADADELGRVLDTSPATISREDAVSALRALEARKRALAPGSSVAGEADAVRERIEDILTAPGPDRIPVRQAQDTKRALADRLTFDSQAPTTALSRELTEAERAGLQHAIETAERAVGPLNARLGPRYALADALAAANDRPGRLLTLHSLAGAGAGAFLSPESALISGVLVRAAQSPLVQSVLARELFRAGRGARHAGRGLALSGPALTRSALIDRAALLDQLGTGSPEPAQP